MNLEQRELAIKVFPYIVETKVFVGGEFDLEDSIYEYIIASTATDGVNLAEEIREETENIARKIRPYLLENKYLELVDTITYFVRLTEKGKEAMELGGIDKYEERIAEENKKVKLATDSLQAQIDNVEISRQAKKISFWALVISGLFSLSSLLISMSNNNSDDITDLKMKIQSIEQRQKQLDEEYVRHIDSLYFEIYKLKKTY